METRFQLHHGSVPRRVSRDFADGLLVDNDGTFVIAEFGADAVTNFHTAAHLKSELQFKQRLDIEGIIIVTTVDIGAVQSPWGARLVCGHLNARCSHLSREGAIPSVVEVGCIRGDAARRTFFARRSINVIDLTFCARSVARNVLHFRQNSLVGNAQGWRTPERHCDTRVGETITLSKGIAIVIFRASCRYNMK